MASVIEIYLTAKRTHNDPQLTNKYPYKRLIGVDKLFRSIWEPQEPIVTIVTYNKLFEPIRL